MKKRINSALISVFNKDGLDEIIKLLDKNKIKIISTGGTAEFIRKLKVPVTEVEAITNYPSLFGGRIKTLQPQVFGGILNRRDNLDDQKEKTKHKIEDIDLVIVDLYPFEKTLASGKSEKEIIEKIDIGGVALIRAAAKNFNDIVVISSKRQYGGLKKILERGNETSLEERKKLAGDAFEITSAYDTAIRGYFQNQNFKNPSNMSRTVLDTSMSRLNLDINDVGIPLRYGENPHQRGEFIGNLEESFIQLRGKELSYNNFIDTEAAIMAVYDFKDPAFAIVKHMNACGLAVRKEGQLLGAYKAAYKADPISAFGGILAANRTIGEDIAKLVKKQGLFVEVIIAPDFTEKALRIFREKKNCRILKCLPAMQGKALQAGNNPMFSNRQIRSCFNGLLVQDRDTHIEKETDFSIVTRRKPTKKEKNDMLVAAVATKNLKSNSVALVKNGALLAMGCGQTSRVDALKQAISKAKKFGFSLKNAVLSSEAFFPFPDCVEMAGKAGISAIIQPGGSKNDEVSVKMADKYKIAMVTTGFRHFKH